MTYPAAHRLSDVNDRSMRARRIVAIIKAYSRLQLPRSSILDVGASRLIIANELARTGANVIAIDVDHSAMAEQSIRERNYAHPVTASGLALPFADGCFDLVICNHVYEHVQAPELLMKEIWRVLRPGGYCYLSAGHKYQLIEPHFRLPFLSWIPIEFADKIVTSLGLGRYDMKFLNQREIAKLWTHFSDSRNLTPTLLSQASRFQVGPAWMHGLLEILPMQITRLVAKIAPTHIWLLRR